MMNIFSQIISIVIASIMCLLVPVTYTAANESLYTSRSALNSVSEYVDVVTDKGSITKADYNDFLSNLFSTGMDFEVSISREKRLVHSIDGEVKTEYVATDFVSSKGGFNGDIECNKGDIITVTIKGKNKQRSTQVLERMLNVYTPNVDYTMTGMVRN